MKPILVPSRIFKPLRTDWFTYADASIRKFFGPLGEISVACVDQKEILRLNSLYRKKKSVTDILSFRIDGIGSDAAVLGELIVCIPVLQKHAQEKKISVNTEFQNMIIHGVVHLLGYDHEKEQEAQGMAELEKKISDDLKKRLAVR